MSEAFLGLGGNLGDRAATLAAATDDLRTAEGVRVTHVSSLYETPPWGPVPQGPYLNACVAIETTLSARALLDLCLAIEKRHGRERLVRWGPRTLDIDLLLYGRETIDEPGLIVPHPRMAERAFVLVPLAEIAPGLMIGGTTIETLLDRLPDTERQDVRRWADDTAG
ncbi:2-amino-4-hydroxy-6-hydroxymethyldihydropteridine diphosphokinase [Kaistia algarum]|uniref:2-amino-4-hydroxy-6- hydroxymethyldihydropteridine diphosphokinase n=1 Tax=Kaistia algarum TaxID=2083279 RepID=UPI000CE7C61A|nr:2-amino-4-hydroxy-6-hydroxymethyldihydropteridine diphosphokinase [Kaistia algarum]MCX5515273.1 2-amino-4-hydroxy-6-hydroxymethyldihydropteridine diphosphokinase [Kaistia algarum]PPE77709.1 2-amino-4-hydroxy-6-hydroxymethyldihydropteridine diphosphokinase [Kaistia algarum]